jgi:hypothetical protein
MSTLYMRNGSNWFPSWDLYGSSWNIHPNTTQLTFTIPRNSLLFPRIFFEVCLSGGKSMLQEMSDGSTDGTYVQDKEYKNIFPQRLVLLKAWIFVNLRVC